MLATGRWLGAWASNRARRDLRSLLTRVPRRARVHGEEGRADLPVDDVDAGDLVILAIGEVVPVDGLVDHDTAVIDGSALNGEPVPCNVVAGERALSGTVNAGPAFNLRVTTQASESTYVAILRLVSESHASVAASARLVHH